MNPVGKQHVEQNNHAEDTDYGDEEIVRDVDCHEGREIRIGGFRFNQFAEVVTWKRV